MSYPSKKSVGQPGQPGKPGQNGKQVELQNQGGWIKWNYAGDQQSHNLISVADLTGNDGRDVTMRIANDLIQWQHAGDTVWQTLISVADITPPPAKIKVGEVSTLPAGSEATATITGEAPVLSLNIGIPQGIPGSDGNPGAPGTDGNGISSLSVTYQQSSSGSSPPTGQWSKTIPPISKGQYLWAKTVMTMSDGYEPTIYSVSYSGADGSPGAPGNPGQPGSNGVGVASSSVSYAASLSGTSSPSSGWSSSVPSVNKGQYLWSRITLNLTDGSLQTAYSVSYFGADGSPGTPGSPGSNGISYSPQTPMTRTISASTAYQHTDTTKGYKVMVSARATQTVTLAGTIGDKIELRIGPSAASVAVNGSGGFSVGVWESGITGIAVMIGAAVSDGGQLTADVPAGWYFSVNRLVGASATIVNCFTQSLTP